MDFSPKMLQITQSELFEAWARLGPMGLGCCSLGSEEGLGFRVLVSRTLGTMTAGDCAGGFHTYRWRGWAPEKSLH